MHFRAQTFSSSELASGPNFDIIKNIATKRGFGKVDMGCPVGDTSVWRLAIKQLTFDVLHDTVSSFAIREVSLLKELNHVNIVMYMGLVILTI